MHCLPGDFRPLAAEGSTENLGTLYSELSLLLGSRSCTWCLRARKLPAERHPGSGCVQTWQQQRGQAAPAFLSSTSLCPSSSWVLWGMTSLQDKCRSSILYTQQRTQFLAWPLHASVPLAQVGKTTTPILPGHRRRSPEGTCRIACAQQSIVYKTISLSVNSTETHNTLVGRDR